MNKRMSMILTMAAFMGGTIASASAAPLHVSTKTISFPNVNDITAVSITGDTPAQIIWKPKNASAVKTAIIDWLATAKPTGVYNLPREVIPDLHDYLGPAHLYLSIKSHSTISIWPAYYIGIASDKQGNNSYSVKYIPGVIVYNDGDTQQAFKDPGLFRWLQQDNWEQVFHTVKFTINLLDKRRIEMMSHTVSNGGIGHFSGIQTKDHIPNNKVYTGGNDSRRGSVKKVKKMGSERAWATQNI